jgi:hypothetical protein
METREGEESRLPASQAKPMITINKRKPAQAIIKRHLETSNSKYRKPKYRTRNDSSNMSPPLRCSNQHTHILWLQAKIVDRFWLSNPQHPTPKSQHDDNAIRQVVSMWVRVASGLCYRVRSMRRQTSPFGQETLRIERDAPQERCYPSSQNHKYKANLDVEA